MLLGLGSCWRLAVTPLQTVLRARSWLGDDCTVLSRRRTGLHESVSGSRRPRHSLSSLAVAVKEIEEIPAYLPSGAALKESVQRARDWLRDVEALRVRVGVCGQWDLPAWAGLRGTR